MRRFLSLALLASLFSPLAAQDSKDRAANILKKIDDAIRKESDRTRAEVLDLIRQELRGAKPEVPPQAAPKLAAGSTEKAKAVVTTELLKKHASFLASDDL